MTIQELRTAIAPLKDGDRVAIRIFMNGQYMASCRILDQWTLESENTLILDADLEISEMEKK